MYTFSIGDEVIDKTLGKGLLVSIDPCIIVLDERVISSVECSKLRHFSTVFENESEVRPYLEELLSDPAPIELSLSDDDLFSLLSKYNLGKIQ